MKISEYREGTERSVVEYAWDGDLAMVRGNGLQIATEREEKVGDDRIVVKTVEDGQGSVSSKIRRTWRRFEWGEELVEKIVDPDGAALTTGIEYVDGRTQSLNGKIAKATNPDGSWKRFEYDAAGRKIKEVFCLLDETNTGADESEVRVVRYDYSPQDPGDSNAPEHASLPRKIVETIGGIEVSRTWKKYEIFEEKEEEETETETGEEDATEIAEGETKVTVARATDRSCVSFDDPKNLKTVKIFNPVDRGRPGSGEPRLVEHPDKSREEYEFERGSVETCPPFENGPWGYHFVPGSHPDETDVRTTLVRGTVDNPDGLVLKTVREISERDRLGNPFGGHAEVCSRNGDEPRYIYMSHWKYVHDERGRLEDFHDRDGTERHILWDCCFKRYEYDEAGSSVSCYRDALGRVVERTVRGGTRNGPTTKYEYDASGRTTARVETDGDAFLPTTFEYDPAGRVVEVVDPAGVAVGYAYSDGGRRVARTRPGQDAAVLERYADGRPKSVSGGGVGDRFYEYGADPDGTRWTKILWGARDSRQWEKAVFDMAGRLSAVEKPAFGQPDGVFGIEYACDESGRFSKIHPQDAAPFLIEYDDAGRVLYTGLDLDFETSPGLREGSEDRMTRYDSRFLQYSTFFEETKISAYRQPGSHITDKATVYVRRQELGEDGLLYQRDLWDNRDHKTVETVRAVSNPNAPGRKVVERRIDRPESELDEVWRYEYGLTTAYADAAGNEFSFVRDEFGRLESHEDPRTGTTTFRYDGKGRLESVEDPAGNAETYAYDPATGRLCAKIDALGHAARYGYDAEGRPARIWGDAAEPVEYVYDVCDRIVEIRTFRKGSGWNSESWPEDATGTADRTRFHYDEATGLLTSVEYANGKTVSWSYTAGGRPKERTWSRKKGSVPVKTTWIRDPRTTEIVGIDYSDDTPGVAFSYDRRGRLSTVSDASGDRRFEYCPSRWAPVSETVFASGPFERTVERTMDRSSMFVARDLGMALGEKYRNDYTFDDFGRLETLRFDLELDSGRILSDTFHCEYLADSNLAKKISAEKGLSRNTAWHAKADLPQTIENRLGRRTISRYDLKRDALWRITDIQKSGEASAMAQKASLARRNPGLRAAGHRPASDGHGRHRRHANGKLHRHFPDTHDLLHRRKTKPSRVFRKEKRCGLGADPSGRGGRRACLTWISLFHLADLII